MVQYKCERCNKLFHLKGDYKRHVKRKFPCTQTIQNSYKIYTEKSNTDKDSTKIAYNNCTQNKKQEKNNICNWCLKTFSQKSSLNRHIKSYCKVKRNDDDEKEDIYNNLLADMNSLRKKVNNLEKENKELKSSLTNNKTINNTINNTVNNTIKLIAYGEEDLDFIVDEASKKILHKGFRSIPVLTLYTHFNKNKPEFHNIYISNMQNHYVMIYDGERWKLLDRDDALDDLISAKLEFLIEKFDKFGTDLPDMTIKKFGNFLNDQYDNETINVIKDELKLILYNNRNLTLDTKTKLGLQLTA